MRNIDADADHPRNHNSPPDEQQDNNVEKSAAGEDDNSTSNSHDVVKNFPSDVAVDPNGRIPTSKHDIHDDDMSGPQYVHSIDGNNDTSANNNYHPFTGRHGNTAVVVEARDRGVNDDDNEVPSRAPTEESSLITAEAPNFSNHTRTGHSRTSYGRNTLSSIGEDDLSFGTSNLISGDSLPSFIIFNDV